MLRYGLIGAGGVGQIHARWAARHPNVEFCAIADPSAGTGLALSAGAKHYADYQKMLDQERLDAVSIAIPHHALAMVGANCLAAGCNILMEKPLARHIAEAGKLLERASRSNLQVGVCYQYRNFASPRSIKQIIDSGQIGAVRHIVWTWQELRPASYYTNTPWRGSWQGAGGGLLMNQLIHDLDLIRWFAGDVENVQASLLNQAHDTPMEDALSASIRFRNGALATISATLNQSRTHNYRAIMGTKGLIVLPDAKMMASDPNDTILIGTYDQGTDAAIASYADDHQQSQIRWKTINSRPRSARRFLPRWLTPRVRRIADIIRPARHGWDHGNRPLNGHGKSVWDFLDAVINGTCLPAGMSGESAYRTLEIANAMTLSGIEAQAVQFPLDPARYSALFEKLVSGQISIGSQGNHAPA